MIEVVVNQENIIQRLSNPKMRGMKAKDGDETREEEEFKNGGKAIEIP